MEKNTENKKMIGTDEAMEILEIGSRNTLKKMIDCGVVTNYQLMPGSPWRFNRKEVMSLMRKNKKHRRK